MKLRLVSNKLGSNSLKELAKRLTVKLGYKVWRSSVAKQNRNNLYYGTSDSCKIKQFIFFHSEGLPSLEYTTEYENAKDWSQDGVTVICRATTRGSQGKGIVVAETPEQIVVAPLYTKYKKKKKEFRVHIFQERVVEVCEKRKRINWVGDRETKIRNLANGYVFCTDGVEEPEGLRELAIKASRVSESDFTGVDIGYNEKKNELFIIEVNSCPGIQGSNLDKYIEVICNATNS